MTEAGFMGPVQRNKQLLRILAHNATRREETLTINTLWAVVQEIEGAQSEPFSGEVWDLKQLLLGVGYLPLKPLPILHDQDQDWLHKDHVRTLADGTALNYHTASVPLTNAELYPWVIAKGKATFPSTRGVWLWAQTSDPLRRVKFRYAVLGDTLQPPQVFDEDEPVDLDDMQIDVGFYWPTAMYKGLQWVSRCSLDMLRTARAGTWVCVPCPAFTEYHTD